MVASQIPEHAGPQLFLLRRALSLWSLEVAGCLARLLRVSLRALALPLGRVGPLVALPGRLFGRLSSARFSGLALSRSPVSLVARSGRHLVLLPGRCPARRLSLARRSSSRSSQLSHFAAVLSLFHGRRARQMRHLGQGFSDWRAV